MSFRVIGRAFMAVAGLAATGEALADPLPVIAVNREIGISALGTFTGLEHRYAYNGSDTELNTFGGQSYSDTYTSSELQRRRYASWVPGFEANGQVMFDLGRIRHLYIAGTFDLGSGRQTHRRVDLNSDTYYGTYTNIFHGSNTRSFTNSTGEIGKGFLLAHDRLLITPVVQGGYYTYGPYYVPQYGMSGAGYTVVGSSPEDRFTAYGMGYVGLALHVDYALTDRLVLRGRAGWAQLLDTHEYLDNQPDAYRHASSPSFQGDLGADYRFGRHWHVTGGVRYTYVDYGRAHADTNYNYSNNYGDGSAFSESGYTHERAHYWGNGVNLRLGIAYGF